MLHLLSSLAVFVKVKASQANFENSKPGHVFLFVYSFKSFIHCEIFTFLSETSMHKGQNSMNQVLKAPTWQKRVFWSMETEECGSGPFSKTVAGYASSGTQRRGVRVWLRYNLLLRL